MKKDHSIPNQKKRRRRPLPYLAFLLTAGFLALGIGCGVYVNDYYRADENALAALKSTEHVTVEIQDDLVLFAPSSPSVGFIFYPGGKVEHTAYAPLLHELAENGVLCVLPEMPFRLAVLDMDAAEGLPETLSEQYPEIQRWYIGGHSLGGSMAASYAAEAVSDAAAAANGAAAADDGISAASAPYTGLVLLASYSTADLTDSGLQVISIYGSNDQVLNLEKYEEYRSNLPADTTEVILNGGNHAQFGSYGPQDGDAKAAITAEEQTAVTAQYLLDYFSIPLK